MKNKHWIGVFSWAALGVLLLQACGGDDEPRRGGEGESCVSADDCGSGLECLANVCTSEGPPSDDAGPTQVRGELGESCSSRSDCALELACVDNVCVAAGTEPVRGQRGESCRSSADCREGLSCINGECAVGDFEIDPTDNECAMVQCAEPADCCPEPNPMCPTWQMECDLGNTTSCTLVMLNCECDETAWDCVENSCQPVATCSNVMLCPGGLVCDDGECVECLVEDDCLGNQTCVDRECVAACETKEDCPRFSICTDGACENVGCQSDRECVAATNNVLSFCNDDAECVQPCSADFECDDPLAFDFRLCIEGFCADAGCETDEECRIRLNVPQGSNLEAVCQPRD